jgi:hypothetical protein
VGEGSAEHTFLIVRFDVGGFWFVEKVICPFVNRPKRINHNQKITACLSRSQLYH